MCSSIERKAAIISFVICLLYAISPFAVAGFISTLVIPAFNLKVRLISMLHIIPKVVKFEPVFADCNSSASVVFEHRVAWLNAPSFHPAPNLIRAAFCHSVNGVSNDGVLPIQTSTAFGSSVFQSSSPNYPLLSAITATVPHYANAHVWSARKNDDSSESLSNKIFRDFGHNQSLPEGEAIARGKI